MMNYIGIDLGTTNSVICSYDGINPPRIWKSPEQNDVTPSAIYIGKRGNRYYGYRAYSRASSDEENVAVLFKRYMGTSNMFVFQDSGVLLSPEECSAEILRVLYGYLPEEIRNDPQTAAVITVPAAFNQVKKEATVKAAHMAGIGKTALMQEPVAAVMSVMRSAGGNSDGVFVIYDLGGGTFDVSIAESIGGKVNLLAQEGKEMCGGRDWDRRIFDSIATPWLRKNFALPENFLADETYRKLRRMTLFAIEQAKIELSQKTSSQETVIQSDDISCADLNGKDIYLDIPLSRDSLNPLIDDLLNETIEISRSAMKKAGLNASDIERLVFVGGPTQYGYLREKVSSELAVRADTGINPMTAVAEGASIFAESVDWSSASHDRKPRKADINIGTALSFKYESRVTGTKARVACRLTISAELIFEIISNDTGWTSGRLPLHDGTQTEIPLAKNGDNSFRVVVYDKLGRQIPIPEPRITITKTLASVESIPASHSISVTALDKLGGSEKLVYLVRKDEALPKKGQIIFKAAQTLRARPDSSLNFNLWEGEIETPFYDNRFIGVYKISGSDLSTGDIIPAGSDIVCDYEISDGGALSMSASVPCLGTDFTRENFYFHDDAELDLNDTGKIADEGLRLMERIDAMSEKIDDARLDVARQKAETAANIDSDIPPEKEEIQEASNELYEARKILSEIRKDHNREMNQTDLDECTDFFIGNAEPYATESERAAFRNLSRTAQRFVNDPGFERYLRELWGKISAILFRQDWFLIDYFKNKIQRPNDYRDREYFNELRSRGLECIRRGDIDSLRGIISELSSITKDLPHDGRHLSVNIIRA